MYVETLNFYVSHLLEKNPEQRIVFAENSGWDLDHLSKRLSKAHKNLEFISIPPPLFNINKGKGYNELLLIREAVKRSRFIDDSDGFMKVTGRYPVFNIDRLLNDASESILHKGFSLYCDIKDHKLYDLLRLGWNGHSFDCRVFGITKRLFMENVAPLYVKCDDYIGSHLLENILFQFVKSHPGKYSLRFKREPRFGGLEGSEISAISFSKDQNSLKGKLKRAIGNGIRIFLPWFYF